jgi:hypothetical protein
MIAFKVPTPGRDIDNNSLADADTEIDLALINLLILAIQAAR